MYMPTLHPELTQRLTRGPNTTYSTCIPLSTNNEHKVWQPQGALGPTYQIHHWMELTNSLPVPTQLSDGASGEAQQVTIACPSKAIKFHSQCKCLQRQMLDDTDPHATSKAADCRWYASAESTHRPGRLPYKDSLSYKDTIFYPIPHCQAV
jgi:hypothetical protein